MERTSLRGNHENMSNNSMGHFDGVHEAHHENYLEVERTFYEFLKNEKRDGIEDEGDFCSAFIYL